MPVSDYHDAVRRFGLHHSNAPRSCSCVGGLSRGISREMEAGAAGLVPVGLVDLTRAEGLMILR